jgi:putative addiction module killer protein
MKIEIDLYVTEEGKVPFIDWLKALKDSSARAKIRVRLDRVRLGNLGDYKALGNGISELRIKYGPGYRVYYGQSGKKIILLLIGGDKSSQQKDIKKAQKFWEDYRRRENENK